MTNTTPARIIAQQIGNGTMCMLGARGRCSEDASGRALTMRIQGSRKCNTITVTLDADDTYTVSFRKVTTPRFNNRTGRFSSGADRTLGEFPGVYADQLHGLIESETGLYTRI